MLWDNISLVSGDMFFSQMQTLLKRGWNGSGVILRKKKIESAAFPASGCGLGGLPWSEVVPLMCGKLHDIGINAAIYLPQETKIIPEHLSETYLLRS